MEKRLYRITVAIALLSVVNIVTSRQRDVGLVTVIRPIEDSYVNDSYVYEEVDPYLGTVSADSAYSDKAPDYVVTKEEELPRRNIVNRMLRGPAKAVGGTFDAIGDVFS